MRVAAGSKTIPRRRPQQGKLTRWEPQRLVPVHLQDRNNVLPSLSRLVRCHHRNNAGSHAHLLTWDGTQRTWQRQREPDAKRSSLPTQAPETDLGQGKGWSLSWLCVRCPTLGEAPSVLGLQGYKCCLSSSAFPSPAQRQLLSRCRTETAGPLPQGPAPAFPRAAPVPRGPAAAGAGPSRRGRATVRRQPAAQRGSGAYAQAQPATRGPVTKFRQEAELIAQHRDARPSSSGRHDRTGPRLKWQAQSIGCQRT